MRPDFFAQLNGRPIDKKADYDAWRNLLKSAGVRHVRLHDGRHTAATLLLSEGVHPRVVMELLGHSQMRTTMDIYSHVMPALAREAADRMIGRRVFVAVPLPEPAFRAVVGLVEGVRAAADPAVRDVRWVRLDGLHLTLRFIGLSDEDEIAAFGEAMDRAAATIAPFEVAIEGAGAFPAVGRPRVLWLDVTNGRDALAAAAAALDDELAIAGLERSDRPYRAHLTVARADGIRAGPEVARRLAEAGAGHLTTFTATEIVLFETIGGGGPARYEPLRRAELRAPDAVRNETAQAGAR